MLNVKLSKEQAAKLPSKEKGYTSGKKDSNGVREQIIFCSNKAFMKYVGLDSAKEFIEI